jgi:hypothetical protein
MDFEEVLEVLGWLIKWACIVAVVVFGIVKCTEWDDARPSTIAARAAEAAQERADMEPHVIREGDGCKVYAFKAGDAYHYFTRCGDGSVTTDRQYQERHGKTTETKTETIVTQGNK